MKIIKITPRGFCDGVIDAWKKILEALRDKNYNKIYMLGMFVHNPKMIGSFKNKEIILLDDSNKSRYDLVKELETVNKNDNNLIILSAHGTDQKTIDLAISKGYKIIDTTCVYVLKTHELIKSALSQNQIIFYLGKKNHPETKAIVSISKKINLIDSIDVFDNLKKYQNKKISVFNQTTLSKYDLEEYYKYIDLNFKNATIHNDICLATQQRQEAIINFNESIDVLIVVGHHKSNNSNELVKIAKAKKYRAYLVNGIEDINDAWFENYYTVAITSGSSTPTWVTNQIIDYLERWKKT